ncbi:MAG: glucuronyl hydrolase [Paenibacillaceae bacterium]|jgi:unsaturated rhamnogalacturonyl hydrolase|nr:glucuronyl hydrolase [Paenibacillaceae bacterium]
MKERDMVLSMDTIDTMNAVDTIKASVGLFQRYESKQEVYHYFGLLAIYALAQTGVEANNPQVIEKAKAMLNEYPKGHLQHHFHFENYYAGGLGKAWLLMMGLYEEQRDLVVEYAERTLRAPVNEQGILCMPTCKEKIWVDVIFAVVPYMMFAGAACNEQRYITFACEQFIRMYEAFLDKECGLMHQCRGFLEDKNQLSADHWSRGNGWCYIGLTEIIRYLPKDSPYYARIRQIYTAFSHAILGYQTETGMWRQDMTSPYSWKESSGTGLFAYGMGMGIRSGLLEKAEFMPAFEKAISGLKKWCINEDYSTNLSCPSCLCPGHGSEKGTKLSYINMMPSYDERHSYGPLMLAMVEAYRNGVHV